MKTLLIDKVEISQQNDTISSKLSSDEKFIVSFLKRMDRGYASIELPNGAIFKTENENEGTCADIKITDSSFFKKVKLYGDVGFGEAYVDGYWETSNITNVISWVLLNFDNVPGLSGSKASKFLWNGFKIVNKLFHSNRSNTEKGSKENISFHYDLSNDFYQLWLDPSMTYSSAYYDSDEKSLYEEQQEKYKKLVDKLQIADGDEIL
jgi:cyclopropane-fatty-acyl-phospholipid synthase